jgi:hypothetical protein
MEAGGVGFTVLSWENECVEGRGGEGAGKVTVEWRAESKCESKARKKYE